MKKTFPNKETQFKKGTSGNLNGRPKGVKNRSTIAKKWLEVVEKIKNPITGELESLTQEDIITLSMIREARNGNVQAYKSLKEDAYGGNLSDDQTKEINININTLD